MFSRLSLRSGLLGVLGVFVLALLVASLGGLFGARSSDRQIHELNLLTAVQLDKLNNAAVYAVRASASSHSALLDRLAGRIEVADQGITGAKERLATAQKLVGEILPTLTDPALISAGNALNSAFGAYAQVVQQQIDSTRAADLAQYSKLNDDAKRLSGEYSQVRERFTQMINQRIAQTMDDSAQRIAQAQLTASALLVLTGLLAVGCWLFLSRQVLAPLRRAGEHFQRMAGGDLSQPVPVHSGNELGVLLRGLDHLQRSQRDTLQHLARTAAAVDQAAERLSHTTRAASDGLQRQHAELEMAVTAVTEMTSAVEEVSRNAIDTSHAAEASNELANGSREQVHRVLQDIERMNGDVRDTGSVIQRLAEQAHGIGKVLDVIRAVSEQTNLLALNAAIEAARAGEAGRGFAVVADEVRTLAHRTQQSTLEIEEMIGTIRASTATAVHTIAQSTERAQGTLDNTLASERMLGQMFDAIGQINERNLVIASATEQQAQVSREVDRNLANLRELALSSGETAELTRSASDELAQLAREMEAIVGKFRLA
ncbi:methyl-accepting chemotaxis protein [Pseudomonas sp. NPDC007930]|uniref:methyl-accepting chemotaxis protein n=1 Tax=Pseudomonas sp. NPDC007930 TaxID=3364417 RepID=UPI0036E7F474